MVQLFVISHGPLGKCLAHVVCGDNQNKQVMFLMMTASLLSGIFIPKKGIC